MMGEETLQLSDHSFRVGQRGMAVDLAGHDVVGLLPHRVHDMVTVGTHLLDAAVDPVTPARNPARTLMTHRDESDCHA